jgi:hypothetical protein
MVSNVHTTDPFANGGGSTNVLSEGQWEEIQISFDDDSRICEDAFFSHHAPGAFTEEEYHCWQVAENIVSSNAKGLPPSGKIRRAAS